MIRRLLLLNGLATLAVPIYHSASAGFIAMFWWTHRYRPVTTPNFDQMGNLSYYALRVIEQLVIFAIPTFLFVSGFFIAVAAGRSRTNVSWSLVANRIKNLAMPYLFWSALIFMSEVAQGRVFSATDYLIRLATGSTIPPYYYVPLLCQLYLVSPLLVLIARSHPKALLLVTGILMLVLKGARYPLVAQAGVPALRTLVVWTPNWFFPGRLFWFTCGILAGFHLEHLKSLLARIKRGLLPALVVLLVGGIVEWESLLRSSGQQWLAPQETILDSLYAGAFILCLLAFDRVRAPVVAEVFARLGRRGTELTETMGAMGATPRLNWRVGRFLVELGSRSFGVYLVHQLVVTYVSKIIYHISPAILAVQFILQPTLVCLGVGVPILLMTAMERSPAREYYKYVFG